MERFHFIGIGGIGMSGVARLLHRRGALVTGTDLEESAITKALREEGIGVFIGHSKDHVPKGARVVYHSRIKESHVERKEAFLSAHRMAVLKEVIFPRKLYAVAGAHGKSSTSALLAHVLREKNYGFCVGAILNNYDSNSKDGEEGFVVELDESDGSFLSVEPEGAIITNIDVDHLDFWKERTHLMKAYETFLHRVKEKEKLFLPYGEVNGFEDFGISYGLDERAKIRAVDIQPRAGKGELYGLEDRLNGESYPNVYLPMMGVHQVKNSLAVYGMARAVGMEPETIFARFRTFSGLKRRLEWRKRKGTMDFFDDYGHHPQELRVVFETIKRHFPDRACQVIFEPHLYSRTKEFFRDFVEVLKLPDRVTLTDTYPAGESFDAKGSGAELAKALEASYVPYASLKEWVARIEDQGQVVLFIGAGRVDRLVDEVA